MRIAMLVTLAVVLAGVGTACEKRIEEARRAPETLSTAHHR